jgi:FixJ family two-component response regulator
MPGMNGTQLVTAVRDKRTGQPGILVTGFAVGGMGEDEEPVGVNLAMRKPVQRR